MNAIYSFPPLAFDEVLYLKANPDIAEAIAEGAFKSGFEHWLLHGQQEGRPRFPQSTKSDFINHLAHVRGYRSYLEICIPTTGRRYAEVDRSKFKICHRLMYRCPKYFDDGMTVDFRSSDLEIGDCVKIIGQQRYDVILVDGFHTYETSLRDLKLALDLLAEEGTIVVHDCDPPNEQVTSTQFNPTAWAGVTYKAYLDFVLGRDDLAYCTVDTDWGCGIIRKKKPGVSCAGSSDGNSVTDEWRRLGQDFHAAFHYLQVNKVSLLNLTTTQDFVYTEDVAGLTRLIDARDEELRQKDGEIAELNSVLTAMLGSKRQKDEEIAELNSVLTAMLGSKRQKDEEIAELNSVLTAMLGSKSWKITGPLRALWRLLHAKK